ncbi:SDR family oxidoreductase [Phragmitibacter flavus]|uniref:SDR family oxidoreductase n=1 Tax=Phragmitibacter flavus TaxID=2576071 RepID=A0A5R8KL53_9BACT|nr:SDR family oxidoreductase [Phragmitibacter flavus]TLD72735.1 SDR family oxidoreductase [Phragmitibacter flavus]
MTAKKTVLITGVSRGLGRAMVDEFIDQGWTVAGCCRSAAAVKELTQQYPAPHLFVQVDVADDSAVGSFCANVVERLGAPDLVLNNAAVINGNAPLWEVPVREFGDVIDINIKGTYSVIRHVTPAMLNRGTGVIVNFSSGWGRSTSPEVAPYCASKYAIEGLSKAMSQETGGRVAVVALNPGIIDTEMLRRCFGDGAGSYDDAKAWAKRAVPYLMKLGVRDNGKSLTAP